ncbi:hypothetical protein ACIOGX_17410 [Streptomyces sp. NPDC088147]|uniref:hypothetical protein n=1 Tax=unclassified Streptomyces TaxID=2593676 RepID=UPI0033AD6635
MSSLSRQVNMSGALATVPLHTTQVHQMEPSDSAVCCPAVLVTFAAGIAFGYALGGGLTEEQ